MSNQALSGLKVVEWGSFIAAPFCAELLAQMGAEIIKIESPGKGDEARTYGPFLGDKTNGEKSGLFLYLNVNKFGITLDPTKPAGREILYKLLKDASVFIVDQPGLDLKELRLDYASLKEVFPKLVVASITPFGATGPYSEWKGYDLNVCALGGISSTIGYPEREPLVPPQHQGEHGAGLMGAIAIMFALFQQEKTGKGIFVDISAADVWATIHIGMGFQSYLEERRVRKRSGHLSPHRPYPDLVLPCKDGSVCIDAPQNRQWQRLLEAMGNPAWATDPVFKDRIATSDDYSEKADAYMKSWLMQHTKAEIFQILRDARVPVAPIRTIDEVASDEHIKQRNYFVEIDHPDAGKFKYPGVAYQFSKTPSVVQRPSPRLGEHNREIYVNRLNMDEKTMEKLITEGVI
jgi:crotonobetainyl-CoA:carnitine CoA-transferase CaiB-like acyl-CoA transferase